MAPSELLAQACSPNNYTAVTNDAPMPSNFCAYAYLPYRARLPDNPAHIDSTNTTRARVYAANSPASSPTGQFMTLGRKPTASNEGNSNYPVFKASATDPLVSVICSNSSYGCSGAGVPGQESWSANVSSIPNFRMPAWTRPSSHMDASGVDHNMEIIQPDGTTIAIYGCHIQRDVVNGDVIGGGAGSLCPSFTGLSRDSIVTSAGVNPGNVNGGNNFAALPVHFNEVQNNQINHALVMISGCFTGEVYPSQFQANGCDSPPGIPSGAHLWLNLTRAQIDATSTNIIPAHMRVFAYALHEYGAYTMDTGNGQKYFNMPFLEDALAYLLRPGAPSLSFWNTWFTSHGGGMSGDANLKMSGTGNTLDLTQLANNLFVLDKCYGLGTCSDSVPEGPAPQVATQFYVAPAASGGSDSNPGTQAQPFLTLGRAQTAVRSATSNGTSMTDNVIVNLRAGTYTLSTPLALTNADSGTGSFRVIWQSFPGEIARISGGQPITGWSAIANGRFQAGTGGVFSRTFVVNGVRANRARHSNTSPPVAELQGTDSGQNRVLVNNTDISGLTSALNSGQVQISTYTYGWQDFFYVTGTSATGSQTWLNLNFSPQDWGRIDGAKYYLYGHLSFLDQQGEWHIDKSTNVLTYWPRAGETMATATAILPRYDQLITVTGSLGNPVRNITFRELRFEYTNMTGLETSGGSPTTVGGFGGPNGADFPSALTLRFANSVHFEQNVFRHMGGNVMYTFGWQNSNFVGNVLYDIGAEGLRIHHSGDGNTNTGNQNRALTVSNNYFVDMAMDANQNIAVDAFSLDASTFHHNECLRVNQGCLSFTHWIDEVPIGNTSVKFNRVDIGMTRATDYGGLYAWGDWPGSIMEENYLTNVQGIGGDGSGTYLDGGYPEVGLAQCRFWTLRNNVYASNDVNGHFHNSGENTIWNMTSPYWDDGGRNTYNTDGSFGATAQNNIRNNAGLESSYAFIRSRITEDQGAAPPPVAKAVRHRIVAK